MYIYLFPQICRGTRAWSKGQGLGVLGGMDKINRISELAKKNKDVAMAVIVQAIIDEGAIGADGTIKITYTSKKNAVYLWEIANAWGLLHPIRNTNYITHTKWCISFRAEKREEIYKLVGPLPDPMHDRMFRHILRKYKGGVHKGRRGETRKKILELLKNKTMTVRGIAYALDLSASTVRTHLRILRKDGKVFISGYNKKSPNKNQRTAQIWAFSMP
jgi:DNA-binding transcriptional ArsR family regulator